MMNNMPAFCARVCSSSSPLALMPVTTAPIASVPAAAACRQDAETSLESRKKRLKRPNSFPRRAEKVPQREERVVRATRDTLPRVRRPRRDGSYTEKKRRGPSLPRRCRLRFCPRRTRRRPPRRRGSARRKSRQTQSVLFLSLSLSLAMDSVNQSRRSLSLGERKHASLDSFKTQRFENPNGGRHCLFLGTVAGSRSSATKVASISLSFSPITG